jgi:hypothetical protein
MTAAERARSRFSSGCRSAVLTYGRPATTGPHDARWRFSNAPALCDTLTRNRQRSARVMRGAPPADVVGVTECKTDEPAEHAGLPLVTTGRTATMLWTSTGLALLAWCIRSAGVVAPEHVVLHEAPVDLPSLLVAPGLLIVLLVVICLNRVLLHGVAWIAAGVMANYGELIGTGALADYIPVGRSLWSPGDVYLTVGTALLALGAIKVVADGLARSRT